MEFEPIIGEYGIFHANPMDLEDELLNLSLPERIIYDPERNILFLNFEGMHVRVVEDVKAIWDICEQRCRAAVLVEHEQRWAIVVFVPKVSLGWVSTDLSPVTK